MKQTDYLIKKYLTPAQRLAEQAEREALERDLAQRAYIDPAIDLMLQCWGNLRRASQSVGGGSMSAIAKLGVVRGKDITATNRLAWEMHDAVQDVIRTTRVSVLARQALSHRYIRNRGTNNDMGWNDRMAARLLGLPPKDVPSFTARAAAQVGLNINSALHQKVLAVINDSTN